LYKKFFVLLTYIPLAIFFLKIPNYFGIGWAVGPSNPKIIGILPSPWGGDGGGGH
jgi:hypothetical protein